MSKKEKEKLTKKHKRKIQSILRADPDSRAAYAEEVAKAVRTSLQYVYEQTNGLSSIDIDNEWEHRQEIKNFIEFWPDKLKEEILTILDLAAGDDIEFNKKDKKVERWELLDLRTNEQ